MSTTFNKKKILVIAAQQSANQYSGEGSGPGDSEQHWMRLLADEIVGLLKTTGHDIRRGPTGTTKSTYKTNVAWVQKPANKDAELLISCHSNAGGNHSAGIGVYHAPRSSKGKAFAAKLMPHLKKVSAAGKAYIDTIGVAEVVSTTPPALLVEHEYHDHNDSKAGGADWIRDPKNRTAIAKAYLAFVTEVFGTKDATEPEPKPEPEPEPEPEPKPIILVAGSANASGDRLHEKYRRRLDIALKLLAKDPKLKVIVTGGIKAGHRVSEAAVATTYLRSKGVDRARILMEDRSGSTYGNFLYGLPIADKAGADRLILVSDKSHMRRMLAFAHAAEKKFDLGVDIGGAEYFDDNRNQDATPDQAAKQARLLWSGMTSKIVNQLTERWL